MDITLKYKIVEKNIQSDDIMLNKIKVILAMPGTDFWLDTPEEIKQAINKAKAEMDNGESIPHHEVMSEIKARFNNNTPAAPGL